MSALVSQFVKYWKEPEISPRTRLGSTVQIRVARGRRLVRARVLAVQARSQRVTGYRGVRYKGQQG